MTTSMQLLSARLLTGSTSRELDVETAQISLDESWSPYAQAQLVIPAASKDAALRDALDPRGDARVQLTATTRYGNGDPAEVLSQRFQGGTAADVSRELVRQTVSAVSLPYFVPYNVAWQAPTVAALTTALVGAAARAISLEYRGQVASTISAAYPAAWGAPELLAGVTREFDLAVRERDVDYGADTVTVVLASDEAVLQDFALVSTIPYTPSILSVRELCVLVLAMAGLATMAPGPFDATIADGAQTWTPGMSAWDFLSPIVQQAGLRLWCDELRQFHLDTGTINLDGDPTELAAGVNLTTATDTITLDDDNWCDAVVVIYTWTDSSGAQQTQYDVASTSPAYRKVKTVSYADTVYPGPGAATAILRRWNAKGRVIACTALTDLHTSPGSPVATDTGDGPLTGYASSVSFAWPDDEMTVKPRDLEAAA